MHKTPGWPDKSNDPEHLSGGAYPRPGLLVVGNRIDHSVGEGVCGGRAGGRGLKGKGFCVAKLVRLRLAISESQCTCAVLAPPALVCGKGWSSVCCSVCCDAGAVSRSQPCTPLPRIAGRRSRPSGPFLLKFLQQAREPQAIR